MTIFISLAYPLHSETMTMPILPRYFFICLLLFSSSTIAQQWYHVEIILFENLTHITPESAPDKTIPDADLLPQMTSHTIRPTSERRLMPEYQRLQQSVDYQVHYHDAWQQPIEVKDKAQSIAMNSPNIKGRIRLYKGTYLYTQIDLQLLHPDHNEHYPYLTQIQRIRAKQLHYFDHPQIGALMTLVPIDTPDDIAIID